MKCKRWNTIFWACMLLFCCSSIPASAIEAPNNSIVMSRVSGRLFYTFAADSTTRVGEQFSATKGDTIKYDCTYTPKSASVDFGYIDSNNVFHYLNYTSGSINQSFEFAKSGQYTLAVRNNEDYAVTVTGTVRY